MSYRMLWVLAATGLCAAADGQAFAQGQQANSADGRPAGLEKNHHADGRYVQYSRQPYSRRRERRFGRRRSEPYRYPSPTPYSSNSPSSSGTFGARSHIDEVAVRLKNQANSVCWEMHNHYQRNPNFRRTYGQMYDILQSTKHIHQLVDDGYHNTRHGTEDHIANDLLTIEQLLQQVRDGVRHWTSGAGGGSVGMRIGSFEDTLRHVMQDYGVNSVARSSPVPGGRPLAGPPPPPLARDVLQGTRQEVVPPQQ